MYSAFSNSSKIVVSKISTEFSVEVMLFHVSCYLTAYLIDE